MKEDIVKLSPYEGCEVLVSPCKRGECVHDGVGYQQICPLSKRFVKLTVSGFFSDDATTEFTYLISVVSTRRTKSKQSRNVRVLSRIA